ncbi:MAG: DUF2460 domain-containing protein [Deltaproteobacteria bacterium]|nr:DUF2460 domain-containing protein [Deltaproteobacteria bacterium]MBW2124226.1 DUF2460 domain-containing protein [Deltaproteobacteria bacterium]
MAKFPDTISAVYPLIEEIAFKTLISNFDNLGEEQRKRKWLYPRRIITLRFNGLSQSDIRTLWQFYLDRSGSYEAFNWFHPYSNTYEGEYVGTGDGSTTVFNLPSKSATSRTLYIDGVSQTEGTNWTFTSEGGADGADKCEFTTAPNSGQRITFDFSGYLKVRCRFAEDIMSFENFVTTLYRTGLKLQGLLNA